MSMPTVQVTSIKRIRVRGVLTTYYPGDWITIGKQTATQWVLDGTARDPAGMIGPPVVPELPQGSKKSDFGIRIRTVEGNVSLAPLGDLVNRVEISYGGPAVPCKYTFIWRPDMVISPRMLNYGFLRVSENAKPETAWEMAARLVFIDKFANAVGSEVEQEKTKKVVGDLRLPVYETGLVWARKCLAAEAVIEAWVEELQKGADEYHSFLRALYTNRAMICTLPTDWSG